MIVNDKQLNKKWVGNGIWLSHETSSFVNKIFYRLAAAFCSKIIVSAKCVCRRFTVLYFLCRVLLEFYFLMTSVRNKKLNCETIHHDAINFSTAKSRFSFSKDKRFININAITTTDYTAKIGTTFGRRSPSFGIGDRFIKPRTSCKRIYINQTFYLSSTSTRDIWYLNQLWWSITYYQNEYFNHFIQIVSL